MLQSGGFSNLLPGGSSAAAATADGMPARRPRVLTAYFFDRSGTCLHYAEWDRPKPVAAGAGSAADDAKMMFGLLFSLRTLAAAVDPRAPDKQQLGAPLHIGQGCGFRSFTTNNYKLHFLESPSGVKIVLTTDAGAGDLSGLLASLYADVFVECAVAHPAYAPGVPFAFDGFTARLNQVLKGAGLL